MLDCAEAVLENLQSLQVNRWLAAIASHYLTTLVEQGQLTTFQTTVDLRAGAMHSLRITLENVRRAGGAGHDGGRAPRTSPLPPTTGSPHLRTGRQNAG